MNKLELIAYAESFTSFLLRHSSLKSADIKNVVLFGSVVRDEASEESDVDIFIDLFDQGRIKELEKISKESLKDFYSSNTFEQWKLRGISNEIKIKVGILARWALKRSIISEGISLYGKYKELPKKLNHFSLFAFEPIKNITKRNRIVRELFGRKEQAFQKEGLIQILGGMRLGSTVFLVPVSVSDQIIKILNKEKVKYKILELWTDTQ